MDMNTSTADVGVTNIGQIAINTHDVERACAFYQDKLGAEAAVQSWARAGVL